MGDTFGAKVSEFLERSDQCMDGDTELLALDIVRELAEFYVNRQASTENESPMSNNQDTVDSVLAHIVTMIPLVRSVPQEKIIAGDPRPEIRAPYKQRVQNDQEMQWIAWVSAYGFSVWVPAWSCEEPSPTILESLQIIRDHLKADLRQKIEARRREVEALESIMNGNPEEAS